MNFLSDIKSPENPLIARLMKREFCQNLILFQERSLYLGGIIELTGFNKKPIICHKKHKGTTTYTLRLKLNMFINSIVSFSSKPLYYIFYIGMFITLFSVGYIVYLVLNKLFFELSISGYTSMMVAILFFGGLNILFLGTIGIYLSKIFLEVKNRPYSIIRKKYEKKDK